MLIVVSCLLALAAVVFAVLYVQQRGRLQAERTARTQEVRRLENEIERQRTASAGREAAQEAALDRHRMLSSLAIHALADDETAVGVFAFDEAGEQLLGQCQGEPLADALAGSGGLLDSLERICIEGGSTSTFYAGALRTFAVREHDEDELRLFTVKDITAADQLQAEHRTANRLDKLTGLYNKSAYLEMAEELLSSDNAPRRACVIFLRTEYAGGLHRSMAAGSVETYLQACADVLRTYSDKGIFCRYTDDVFCGVLCGEDRASVTGTLEALWRDVEQQSKVLALVDEGKPRVILGASWYPYDSTMFTKLHSYARFAVYDARKEGRGGLQIFDSEAFAGSGGLLEGPEILRELIDRRMVRIALRPIVESASAKVYAYEFSMRPTHPSMKSMEDVLDQAILQGSLYEIERLLWFEGMRLFSSLVKAGKILYSTKAWLRSFDGVSLPVHMSLEFEEAYYDYLKNMIVELSENRPEQLECAEVKRRRTAEMGAQCAIACAASDQESELSMLFFRPEIVRIRAQIVRGMSKSNSRQEQFAQLVQSAHKRGARVLAEGIDSAADLKAAIRFGADYLQGDYLGRSELGPTEIPEKRIAEIGNAQYGMRG